MDQEDDSREADISSDCSTSMSPEEEIIYHKVSKHDNLAGVAVKYGVTVYDIKAANGLHSDAAMFARDTLFIPTGKARDTPTINRQARVRFAGGLTTRSSDPGMGSGTGTPGHHSPVVLGTPEPHLVNDFFHSHRSPVRVQEIELHEHVSYAGDLPGPDERCFGDKVRRRKREGDSEESMGDLPGTSAGSWPNPGRPPTVPGRSRECTENPIANEGTSTLFDYVKGIPTAFIGRVKEVMNSPAFGTEEMSVPSLWRYGDGSQVGGGMQAVRGSDSGLQRIGSTSSISSAAKACPKSD